MRDPLLRTRSRDQISADLRAELDGWIAERVAELVASGVNPDDARRRALAEFGNVSVAERYAERQDVAADRRARILQWLEELGGDLKIAARTLRRTPAVTAVVLLTFALGIGATTAVFSVVHALLLRPLPFADEQQLVALPALDKGIVGPNPRHSAASFAALLDGTTSFSGIVSVEGGNYIISEAGEPEQVRGSALTARAFDVMGVRPAIGRTFERPADGDAEVVVLLDGLWRRRFGADPNVIGRMIDLSGERREVVGVMAPDFRVPTLPDAQLLVVGRDNLSAFLANSRARDVRATRLIGRLKPGVSLAVAQADVDRTMKSLATQVPKFYADMTTRVVPIRTAIAGQARPRLLVLMGAALFVLLIACANVAGILLARGMSRRHELSVRVALGAGRRRLVRQFVAEGVVLATAGVALGLMVAQLGIVALRRIAVSVLPEGTLFSLEPNVVLFAFGIAVVGAIAASLIPALGATRSLGVAFRRDQGHASASRASRRVRLSLVAAQLSVSVVLLVGAGLFLRTLRRLSVLDLGYETEHMLTFRPVFTHSKTDAEQDAFFGALYAGLRSLPGVTSVGGGAVPLSGSSFITGLQVDGRPLEKEQLPQVRNSTASEDYFTTLRIPVLRGRTFTPEDDDGAPWVAVVSERLAKQLWPGADPIGARVKTEPEKPWATVIGVVGDVKMGGADEALPSVYTAQRQDQWPGGSTVVVRAAGDPVRLMAGIRRVLHEVDPTIVPVGARTLDEFRRSTPAIAERMLLLRLVGAFAVAALIVSAIGVYGVSAHATAARAREFGIRIALGATRGRVLRLALGEGTGVAIVGVVVGVPLALLLASRLGSLLYDVAPYDPLTVGLVLGVLTLVVVAASFVPARRATLVDPARTMRVD
jgi:predicted permease